MLHLLSFGAVLLWGEGEEQVLLGRSEAAKGTLDPKWGTVCQFDVHSPSTEVVMEVFDYDMGPLVPAPASWLATSPSRVHKH